MTTLIMEGFDFEDATTILSRWQSDGGDGFTLTGGHIELTAAGGLIHMHRTSAVHDPTVHFGVQFKVDSFAHGGDGTILGIGEDTIDASHLTIGYNTSGILEAHFGVFGGTLRASSDDPIPLNTWMYIHGTLTVNNSTGAAQIFLDGEEWCNVSGVDMQSGSSAYANRLQFNGPTSGFSVKSIDNLYLLSSTGTYNTASPGPAEVLTQFPSADGDLVEWDPSAGSNFQCVDDAVPDADTSYVSSGIDGRWDIYHHVGIETGEACHGIEVVILARDDDAAGHLVAPSMRVADGFDNNPTPSSMTSSYAYYSTIWEENPDDSTVLSTNDINDTQFGVYHDDDNAGAGLARCSQAVMQILVERTASGGGGGGTGTRVQVIAG